MTYRKLSFAEAVQGLRESLNSDFDAEREIAQILLTQHYGLRGHINNTKGVKTNEAVNKHTNYISDKHME